VTTPEFDESCDFCAIARGDAGSTELVCEAANWVAFFPLKPATPGHTLIIPRRHVEDLWQADQDLAADLMGAVQRVGHAVQRALEPDGMNLITSAGSAAEQTVFHLHLHVVPRWARDGFGKIWPIDRSYNDPALEEMARRIRDAC
jgi:histidine triad (HIT) family protein